MHRKPYPQAVFLDRDGVINQNRADYVKAWAEFHFLPGALAALSRLAALPVTVLVITNQSAVGRGLITPTTLAEIHRHMLAAIRAAGGRIDAIYHCPHTPAAGCGCRKPRPGLLLRAAREHGLDLSRSTFIGDAVSDLEAAAAAGCRPLLVRTGRGAETVHSLRALPHLQVRLAEDLSAAVDQLAAELGTPGR